MESGSNNRTDGNTSVDPLIPLYVTLSILCLLMVLVAVFIKRRTINSPESKAVQLRAQNTEEDTDLDCSPYAVGCGEENIDLGSKWISSQKADTSYEESATSLDPYSVVRIQE
ncbi:uncharacterized protein LOC143508497 [Brachyhypopomus gauderio]